MAKEKLTYSEAVQEIEKILEEIEKGELDIDELAENVKRVTDLLRLCKEKLHKTEEEIDRIFGDEKELND